MKYWIRAFLASCAVLLGGSIPLQAAAAEPIQVEVPGEGESTIASGRNFYVKGSYTLPEGYAASRVAVTLYCPGSPEAVRRVQGDVKEPSLWVDGNTAVSFNSWGSMEDIKGSGMPDLIWDGADSSTFYQGWRKCYFDDTGFAALIPGGEGTVDDGLDLVDEDGNLYGVLDEGDYLLEVSVSCQDGQGNTDVLKCEQQVTIGATADKLLSRFSPSSHMERITEWAGQQGYRIYNDPFAGNWWGSNFEIPEEMRAGDMAEYSAGRSHFVIYNVSSGSTTYKVELAWLQKQGVVDNPGRLVSHYYQYGEPELKNAQESQIVAFEAGDKLEFTRAEVGGPSDKDGVYDQDSMEIPDYDLDFTDGVQAEAGDTLAVYGVTAPIQIAPEDIQEIGEGTDKNSFLLKNKIRTLRYEITGDGVAETLYKEVALNRISGGWDNPSDLEFKHVIPITQKMAGKELDVSVKGYDAHGEAVAGTDETFKIHVAEAEKPGRADITSITSTPQTVTLKWKSASDADRYEVYRYDTAQKKWAKAGEAKKTSYKDKGLSSATAYKYRIRSVRQVSDGQELYGAYGNTEKILTHPAVPRKIKFRRPARVTAAGEAILTMDVSKRADGYYIYRRKSGKYSLAYEIRGKKVYLYTDGKKAKQIGTAKISGGKLTCTLTGLPFRVKVLTHLKVCSYVTQNGYQQQESKHSKVKELY